MRVVHSAAFHMSGSAKFRSFALGLLAAVSASGYLFTLAGCSREPKSAGGVERLLRGSGARLGPLALRLDGGQFGLAAEEVAVAVLEDEELFDDFEHARLSLFARSYRPCYGKSMHAAVYGYDRAIFTLPPT